MAGVQGNEANGWEGGAIYAQAEGVVLRTVADESLLVPTQKGLADLQKIFALNKVGVCIWQRIDGVSSLDSIVAEVVSRFEVTAEQARVDINSFVEDLASIQLVTRRT